MEDSETVHCDADLNLMLITLFFLMILLSGPLLDLFCSTPPVTMIHAGRHSLGVFLLMFSLNDLAETFPLTNRCTAGFLD